MIIKTFTFTLLLQLLRLSLGQFQGCPTSILSDPVSLGRLIATTITANDDQSPPSIAVTRNNTVCVSVGPDFGTISSFSIVVEYDCSGHTVCNYTTGSAEDNTTIVEQFDFGCQITNGNIHGWAATQFGRAGSRVPSADFSTELRRNCSACIEIGVVDALRIGHLLHIDPVSRCLACNDECADVGMGLCYGLGSNMCCNYLLNDSCVDLCPNTTQPNSNHNCKRVVIGFEERVYLTDERDDLLVLPVNVKEGELTQKVTLLVTTQDRTTTAGKDYVMKNRKVQLIPRRNGGSSQVKVVIPNDNLLEVDEEFVIYLELQAGSSAFLDISSTIIVIMGDQDVTEEPSDDSEVNTTMVITSETPTTAMIENGCEPERDETWELMWPLTAQEHTATIPCGSDNNGIATRKCMLGAVWGVANVSLCENVAIAEIGRVAEELFSSPDVHPNDALVIVRELANATSESASTNRSQLPRDLITVSDIVAETVDLLLNSIQSNESKQVKEVNLNETEVVLDVLSTILTYKNMDGFSSLEDVHVTQEVLLSAEKYNQYIGIAALLNDSRTSDQILYSGDSIVLVSERINSGAGEDITFPKTNELQNISRNESENPVAVTVTGALLDHVYDGNVSVTHLFFRDLRHLLPTIYENGTVPKTFVVSSEIYGNLRKSSGQYPFKDTPIYLTYTLELSELEESPRCAFWDFSNGIAESGWSTDGLKTESVTRDGNTVTITCSTTHLTSFAVLVDVSGGGSKSANHKPLEVISYMGISISIACLFLTIIFFSSIGKKLFSTVHNFVHLNLSISLFLAYVIFAIGIEVASSNETGCKAVAALIQYFLLSAFCWMMCEGIMLYLMLVVVFSRLKDKWWLFFMLGWGSPLIFVVIGLSTVSDEYGVRDSDGDLQYCWLASGDGKHAIWTFVAPMLAVITVNTVFLVLVMRSIYISRKSQDSRNKNGQKRYSLAVYIVKASVILLPLLGLTWLFGLLAINENTVVFAWLFTIFNSLQGVSIFIFHVFRNDRIWGRFRKSIVDPDGFLRSFSRRTMRSSIGHYSSRFSKQQCDSEMEMKSHSEPMSSTSGITTHSAIPDPEVVFEPRESTIITSSTNGSLDDDSCGVTTTSVPTNTSSPPNEDLPLIDVPLNNDSTDHSVAVATHDNHTITLTTAKAANGILSYKI